MPDMPHSSFVCATFLLGIIAVTPAHSVAVEPPLDAVSRWAAEDDATDSVGSNDGTLENGATFADGIVGKAFHLDGTDDFVEVPSDASLRPGDGSFTGSVWFLRTGPTTFVDQTIPLLSMVDGDYDNGWMIGGGGTLLTTGPSCGVDDETHTISQVIGSPVAEDTFAHLACVYDAAGDSLSLFVNGALHASGVAVEGTIAPSSDLYIGRYRRHSIGGRDEFFPGLIDDAKYFARALADEEVASIFMDVIPLLVGDIDCSATINATDASKTLRKAVGSTIPQFQPCPRVLDLLAGVAWGDVDCSGDLTATDALKVLRHAVGSSSTQNEPCANLGESPL